MRWPERLAALTLAWVVLTTARPADAQVSPGPLARAHADLDQLTKCLLCHTRSETMAQRCLACHTEIAWSKAEKRGLHARADYAKCESCHPDHAGRDFAMVRWDEGSAERFRHERTGYALTGAHAALRCAQCHTAANQKSAVAPKIKKKNRAESFLGLERACASCHTDPHAGRFGATCDKCHKTTAWAALDASTFDHEKTRYPLRGRHAELACAACHDATHAWGPKPRFDRCDACHKDAHAGTATLAGKPADCAACHGLKGFAPSTFTLVMHDKSAYPLAGKHRQVECATCHRSKDAALSASTGSAGFRFRLEHAACASCHGQPHGTEFAGAKASPTCAPCHDLEGFRPSRFSVASHAKTAFPLLGTHAAADCRACHDVRRTGLAPLAPAAVTRAGTAAFAMSIPERACADCHADPHAGRFRSSTSCADCHGITSFRPSLVSVGEHARYSFPLEGAHRAVPCADCHRDVKSGALPAGHGASLVRAERRASPLTFAVAERACASCHADPHAGQFASPASRARTCERCHGLEAFRPAERFDHGRDTAFPLDGAHKGVACARCHAAATVASSAGATGTGAGAAKKIVRYRGVSAACESCHPTSGAKR